MFRRRRRDDASAPDAETAADAEAGQPGDDDEAGEPEKTSRPNGPFDASEVDLDDARAGRVDLGGLLVKGAPGMQVQLQVDKRTGKATAALLAQGEAAVELMAVAAPRSSGWWRHNREQLATDARKRGGTAEEARGPFGVELRVVVPMTTPEGKQGLQPSRVSGIDGPRWMLRARFLGKAVTDATSLQSLVDVVQSAVVIRGDGPMAPGDVIALQPPAGQQSADGDQQAPAGQQPGQQGPAGQQQTPGDAS